MNAPRSLLLAAIAGFIMTGCGNSDEPPKPPPQSKPQGTVFDGMISQKERARKGVEDAMQKNKEKLEQSMQKNEPEHPAE